MRKWLKRTKNVVIWSIVRVFLVYLVRPIRRTIRRIGSSTSEAVRQIERLGTHQRPPRRWANVFFAVPALIVLLVAGIVAAKAINTQRQLGRRYVAQGMKLADNGNYHAAQIHLSRAIELGGIDSREAEFGLAIVWGRLGYSGRSMQAFQKLAPINRRGFAKAHRHLAIIISTQQANRPSSNNVLARWLWHLTHADQQQTAEVQESWGNYYLAVDDLQGAINAYQNAAVKYPRLYLAMARLHQRLGQIELRTSTLRQSEQRFRKRLRDNPNDRKARVVFATTLLQLGELLEAEQVLRTGLRLDPEGPYQLLLAATFVQLHDKLMEKGPDYQDEALQQLRNALEFDSNFPPALKRLLGFAQVAEHAIPELRSMLNEVLSSGKGTALAHLALSNLAWLENKQKLATFHLDQAMALDGKMPIIANNLAWLLAHAETPDFDRALKIAESVVAQHPNNPRFLDTRGTVLALAGRPNEALIDFEKALPTIENRPPLHRKIAKIYRDLGMIDIARNHEKQAGPLP